MIESYFWKKDLLNHAKALKPVAKPPRWSEKLVVNFEKNLIISFFMIRKLLEEYRVSKKSYDYRASIYECRSVHPTITIRNSHRIAELYDLDNPKLILKDISFITNQFIHSCTIFSNRISLQNRNWEGVYVCSEYERNKRIFFVPIAEIIQIFNLVGNDYNDSYSYIWDEKINDYKITVY
jgi:hypothetical protein